MIKKRHILLWTLALLALAGCHRDKDENRLTVADSQLEGLWVKSGSEEYWRYRADHSGVTWDAADSFGEEESNLTYTWSVNGDVLTHVFAGAQGNQAVPKVYTVTQISSAAMKWEDDYGMSYQFAKVTEQ